MKITKETVLGIVGLGYVGLPLAIEFGKKYKTIGFDLSKAKIESYKKYVDPTGEMTAENLKSAKFFVPSSNPSEIGVADVIIIAVPTPIDSAKRPDFSPLIKASELVGSHMKKGSLIIYESTVYPGATQEICVPTLEKFSGMKWKEDFFVGYSPERVNPGDKEHTITKIVKVVSGDTQLTLSAVSQLYSSVIDAGVHEASSICVAEAAKVIENTQRDLNIALMNELAKIFQILEIDTMSVLQAAGTKWNFLNFRPGLVGGHCIGVDPYYLTCKAEMLGYHPEVILAGRRVNDGMSAYIAKQIVKQLIKADIPVKGAKVLILGVTFKENCSDLRNSKVVDIVNEMLDFGCDVSIHDPLASPADALEEYGLALTPWNEIGSVDCIVAAVSHSIYLESGVNDILSKLNVGGVFIDVKSTYPQKQILDKGYNLWRL
jgi:UDP-N-acetyl-D-galactosamine dehydrogenase